MTNKLIKKMQIDTMLKHLKMALSYCSIYQDIRDLTYDPDKEVVICKYSYTMALDDKKRERTDIIEINVACDSNSAMIKDVIERLDNFFG